MRSLLVRHCEILHSVQNDKLYFGYRCTIIAIVIGLKIQREVVAHAHTPEEVLLHRIIHHLSRHRQGSSMLKLKLMASAEIQVANAKVIVSIVVRLKRK